MDHRQQPAFSDFSLHIFRSSCAFLLFLPRWNKFSGLWGIVEEPFRFRHFGRMGSYPFQHGHYGRDHHIIHPFLLAGISTARPSAGFLLLLALAPLVTPAKHNPSNSWHHVRAITKRWGLAEPSIQLAAPLEPPLLQ